MKMRASHEDKPTTAAMAFPAGIILQKGRAAIMMTKGPAQAHRNAFCAVSETERKTFRSLEQRSIAQRPFNNGYTEHRHERHRRSSRQ
jgi:hypothetical protein